MNCETKRLPFPLPESIRDDLIQESKQALLYRGKNKELFEAHNKEVDRILEKAIVLHGVSIH